MNAPKKMADLARARPRLSARRRRRGGAALDPKSADEYFGIKYLSGTSRVP